MTSTAKNSPQLDPDRDVTVLRVMDPQPNVLHSYIAVHGLIVMNAPRPLRGHIEWQDRFRHGVFYAAIKPNVHPAIDYFIENLDLDGWVIECPTSEQIDAWITQMCELRKVARDKFSEEKWLEFFHLQNLTGTKKAAEIWPAL